MTTPSTILSFLESRASNAPLNPAQYADLVSNLRSQLNQLSVSVSGAAVDAVTVLYSGRMTDGTHSGAAAQALVDANPTGKVLTINQTQIYSLLNDDRFSDALKKALGNDPIAFQSLIDGDTGPDGKRIPNSLWDDASKRFALNATGDVRVIAPLGDPFRVFAQTELPALLDNTSVRSIDGIPREQLVAMRNSQGLAGVQKFVFDHALFQSHLSGMATGSTTNYLSVVPDQYETLLKDPAKFKLVDNALGAMDISRYTDFKTNMSAAMGVAHQLSASGVGKFVNKLGLVGGVLGFMLASNSAAAAERAGNSAQAKEIMKLWAIEMVGSEVGSVIGATVGAVAIGVAVGAGVVVSAPLAGAVVVGAAIVGNKGVRLHLI
jgi:hypothetical protein